MIRVRNKSALTTPVSIPNSATIVPFDTVDISTNMAANLSGNSVQMASVGLYDTVCVVDIINAGDAAVTATLTVYADGEAVQGAFATETIPASGTAEIVLPWTVSVVSAASGIANVSWYLSGAAVSMANAYAEVKRIV